MANVLDPYYRKKVIDEINANENRARKNDSLRKFDIYQKRQQRYIDEKLQREYSAETVREMRIISSINLARRITDEKASLYNTAPTRTFGRVSGKPLTENEQKQLESLYQFGKVDLGMKKANRYFKLESQCLLQWLPKNGAITPRVLLPHHVDVIPWPDDPERPMAVIVSVYDRSLLYNQTYQSAGTSSNYLSESESDRMNQTIADADDENAGQNRYIWWTDQWNFLTDGYGNLIDSMGNQIRLNTVEDIQMLANPIGMLPFVDVATGKEFEFWVRQGNDVVQFAIDFSTLLSDTAEVNKRQGYSQAIVYSEEPPKDMLIGPNRVLHMKLDPNKETQPRFEWSTPQPDMQASLELLESYLRLFLSSEGIDPKTVSGKLDGVRYSSGVDRLLAMIDKFEASRDDIDLFKHVENQSLRIIAAWSNLMQGATIDGGSVAPLMAELQTATLPDDLMVTVEYKKPEAIKTDNEQLDVAARKIEIGLMSRKMALMELHGLTDEQATKLMAEIDADDMLTGNGGDETDGDAPKGPVQN